MPTLTATAAPATAPTQTPGTLTPYVRRAPQTEPPYDTEDWRPEISRAELGLGGPVQGTLALSFAPARSSPFVSRHGRPLRLVLDDDDADEPAEPPARTPRAQLPDPRATGLGLALALGEALAGVRPADQLARSFTETAFDSVLAAVPARKLAARRSARTAGRAAGQAVGRTAASAARARVKVRSVRSFEPADGVAEVCAHVLVGDRARALALRLEGMAGRWVCTEVHIG
ncbi:MAG: Rv3235 family protein [Sporichthyaceae bacterium]|nr:Rv3235 family protein [Sporichthyaceae bacterium]